jgi:methylated-DNA-[protein]-cysteine S-methyltransferase
MTSIHLVTNELACITVASPVGSLVLRASNAGLVSIDRGKAARVKGAAKAERILGTTATQLAEYFAGTRRKFTVPLDLHGTPFQVQVWCTLQKIPFGKAVSYAEEARMLGKPKAARAVGSANGRNPVPIIVPCHRVVSADGTLGGYSAGLPMKRKLLALEGVSVAG